MEAKIMNISKMAVTQFCQKVTCICLALARPNVLASKTLNNCKNINGHISKTNKDNYV